MKKNLLLYFTLLLSVVLFQINVFASGLRVVKTNVAAHAMESNDFNSSDTTITKTTPQKTIKNPEKKLRYTRSLLNKDFDFSLEATSKGKFSLSFFNNTNEAVAIKVYDVIGNLIFTEQISVKGNFVKEYDLSFYKTDFFVVEVGNARYNKTKSVAAV